MDTARRSRPRLRCGTETRIRSIMLSAVSLETWVAMALSPSRAAEGHHLGATPVPGGRLGVPDSRACIRHEHVVEARAGDAHRADGHGQLREEPRHELLAVLHAEGDLVLADGRVVDAQLALELPHRRLVIARG